MVGAAAKLVPAGIRRKLDPSLPGLDESIADLEGVSLPRFQIGFPPQRLIMTVLGDYWAGREEAIPSAALVALLASLDIAEAAARVALTRLADRGAVILERRGRTTLYRQSPALLRVLRHGRAVTDRFGPPRAGWNGTWTVLVWNVTNQSSALSHRFRTDLRELGFASLTNGVWVSPDAPDPQLAVLLEHATDVRYSLLTGARELSTHSMDPTAAWDLADVRPMYEEFVATFEPVLRSGHAGLGPSASFAIRTRAVYRWFVIATLDPDLPVELLPDNWPRTGAHDLFVELMGLVSDRAEAHVRSVFVEFDPVLAELVTSPRPY